MDAKRWSPLFVFGGGCLTGAALIVLHSAGNGRVERASNSDDPYGHSAFAAASLKAESAEPLQAPQPVHDDLGATPQAAPQARDTAEAGNSLAEVLARLETDYRQRTPSALAAEPSSPRSAEPSPSLPEEPPKESRDQEASEGSAAAAPKPTERELPVAVRAAPLPTQAPAVDAPSATVPPDPKPTLPTVEETTTRIASLRDSQNSAFASGQQVTAQIQQLTALQEATLVQQAALFQYLSLLAQSGSPPTVLSARRQRHPAPNGRIVATLPSSISDTDNPWGFAWNPTGLVR